MQLTESFEVDAPLDTVWEALNNPDVMKQCIPLCESFARTDDNNYAAVASVEYGLVHGTYKGKIILKAPDGPRSYIISGECDGGAAGSAKGRARVEFSEPSPGCTRISYNLDVKTAGFLAELGQRNVYGAAKWVTRRFRDKFTSILAPAARSMAPSQNIIAQTKAGAGQAAPLEKQGGLIRLLAAVVLTALTIIVAWLVFA